MSVKPPESGQDFDLLRQAREGRGWKPEQVAERLHIRATQVEALEQGNFAALPGPAFARGYLKNYARLLDLDPEPLLDLFDRYSGGAGLKPTDQVLPDTEDSLLDYSRPMLLLSLLVAAGIAAIAWWLWGGGAATPTGAESKATVTEAGASAAAASSASASASTASSAAPLAVPAPSSAVTSSGSSASTAGGVVVALAKSAAATTAGLHFSFTGRCWVQVQDARGRTLLAQLAQAGQTLSVDQGQPPYRVLVGKADNVQISYDGKPVPLPSNALGVARLQVGTAPAQSVPAGGAASVSSSPKREPEPRPKGPAAAGMDSPVTSRLSSPQSDTSIGGETPPSRLQGAASPSAPVTS